MELLRYSGGRRWLLGAGVSAVVGLLATGAGAFLSPRRALFSYLVAFAYWAGIAVASLILLMILHAAKARWSVVLRRPLEAMALSVVPMAPLFVPVALGLGLLFSWASAPAAHAGASGDGATTHGAEADLSHHLEAKRFWLNAPFFLGRSTLYFAIWIVIAALLWTWSLRQDEDGAARWTRLQRALGAGGLPALGLSFTFASFDWLMSLHPLWYSTIFGLYFFAGSFLAAFALLVVVAARGRGGPFFGTALGPGHFHALGKFLLAFVGFWAYIGFCQLMLIWIANIPEEVPWYFVRIGGGWRWVGVALGLGHFVLPFAVLLSQGLKRRPERLAGVALFLLAMHYLDVYWLVLPALDPEGPRPSWTDVTAFLGVGGVAVGFGLFCLRGRFVLPLRDPFLEDSLRYGR